MARELRVTIRDDDSDADEYFEETYEKIEWLLKSRYNYDDYDLTEVDI